MSGFLSFIKDFFWVPIISAIVGGLITIFVPRLFLIIGGKIKRKINKSIDIINIEGDWNSFFHEEDIIKSEKVILKQEGQYITGFITLGATRYEFKGEFKNQILTGTYCSKNPKKYESGTITVRRINEFLMSGYCTFVYKDKQVYNSPYVLSNESHHKVSKGTYPFCNTCVGKFDCCCNCNEIDMPILLPNEADSISRYSRLSIDSFAKKITTNLYQMKREDDNALKGCHFFQNNKCTIYEHRPIDCRLFPFDFKDINGEYWLVYYDNINVCKAIPTNKKEIEYCAHNTRPLLEMVLPYMSECSDPIFCERLKSQSYIKLFPINKIRDDVLD